MTLSNVILVLATICTALMAGLFYSYSCSVSPGLKLLDDTQYIGAMQSINSAIQNFAFFTCFFGTLLLLPLCAWLQYIHHPPIRFWLVLAAALLYLTGVFGVTVFGNILLNNALDKFNLLSASKESISLQRILFEQRWNNLNTIRTISSILSMVLLVFACISNDKSQLPILK